VSERPGASTPRGAPSTWDGLHVLADDDPRWRIDPVAQGEAACRGGARVVQLRVKHAPDRQAIDWGRALRAVTRRHGVALVVNDRFDLALACAADAVHLGQTDLPPARVADAVAGRLAVGRSTHTLEQARAAREEPVDYVAYGPLFGTQSKESEYAPRGAARLAEVVACVAPRPVVAIGGIDAVNLADAIGAGARGVAVISAVAGAEDPEAATRALVRALDDAAAKRSARG
jgi:thiamine-phosphate pyrophosphorylase